MNDGAIRSKDGGLAKFDKQSGATRGTLREDSYLDIRKPAGQVRNP